MENFFFLKKEYKKIYYLNFENFKSDFYSFIHRGHGMNKIPCKIELTHPRTDLACKNLS